MKSLGKYISDALDFNEATLSGALDVIVIQQSDGSLRASPFHVRFGGLKLFKCNKNTVQLIVNGQLTPVSMQTVKTGQAVFVENSVSEEVSESPRAAEVLEVPEKPQSRFDKFLSLFTQTEKQPPKRESFDIPTEFLSQLGLVPGINTVEYTVSSSLQGSASIQGRIFLWDELTKIVISDIDGTITKSDVLGNVLPIIGKDWTQPSIAELYTRIEERGYKIMYLSARNIGMAERTKDYLRSIEQDGYSMPDGPVFLSPDRTYSSFVREVITKTPQHLKTSVLFSIKKLFPEGSSPFAAGFGNRDTDAIAYRSAGVDINKIFQVDSMGKVVDVRKSREETYYELANRIQEVFP